MSFNPSAGLWREVRVGPRPDSRTAQRRFPYRDAIVLSRPSLFYFSFLDWAGLILSCFGVDTDRLLAMRFAVTTRAHWIARHGMGRLSPGRSSQVSATCRAD